MLTLKKNTAKLIADAVRAGFGEGLLSADEIFTMLEYPPDRTMGDIALPCFRLSKSLRRSPVQIAEMLAGAINCEGNPTYKDFVKAVFSYKAELDKPEYVEKSSHSERRLRTNWCNHYENNLIVRASRPYKLDVGEDSASGIETNFITNESVGFVNEEAHDYRLNPDSIVFEKIRGFVAPPFEKMGPINDQ